MDRLTRELLNEPLFYVHCYEAIRSNPGTMAQGGAEEGLRTETLDGIDGAYFANLARTIGSGQYQFGATRQVEIPKRDGGTRPLGIAASRDKIVQKAMAVILEAVGEHRFYEGSFGFRRGRSAHSAMAFIKRRVVSGCWAIEGDISKCFDSFETKRLASLVARKYVGTQIFIDLLRMSLKTKVVTLTSSFVRQAGTPQGSMVSPILANIYLHELDLFVTEGEELRRYRGTGGATANPAYLRRLRPDPSVVLAAHRARNKGRKRRYWQLLYRERARKLRGVLANRGGVHSRRLGAHTRRLLHVRYADDFIVFLWGSEAEAQQVRERIRCFLKGQLGLTLSRAKTHITHLPTQKARFLGFLIWQTPPLVTERRDMNPAGKRSPEGRAGKYRYPTPSHPRIRVTFPLEELLEKLLEKGMVRRRADGGYLPQSYKSALLYEVPGIIRMLSSVFRGLMNYFGVADNWYDAKNLMNYWGRYVAAMTVAHKTKSRVAEVFRRYGENLTVRKGDKTVLATWPTFKTREEVGPKLLNGREFNPPPSVELEDLLAKHLRLAKLSVVHHPCAVCGESGAEMHHLRSVRQALKGKRRGSLDYYREALRLVNRKVLPLCPKHHRMVHRGEYDGEALRSIFAYYGAMGAGAPKGEAEALLAQAEREGGEANSLRSVPRRSPA